MLGGVVVVALVVVVLAIARDDAPELAAVETFPDMGRDHLAPGETPPEYNSDPPTSGPHAAQAAACGVYDSEVPDHIQVHNLEHGAIVVQYRPDLGQTEVEALRDYARSKASHILLAPRSDLTHPVVVTSWTRMLRLDSIDLDTVEAYYQRYVGTGPEVGVPCPFAVDEAA